MSGGVAGIEVDTPTMYSALMAGKYVRWLRHEEAEALIAAGAKRGPTYGRLMP